MRCAQRIAFSFVVSMFSIELNAQQPTNEAAFEFFERDVRPLLLELCTSCHSEKAGKVMGGLNLDSRDGLLAGGDSGSAIDLESPDQSLLLQAVRRESFEMPPDKPLTKQQIGALERWLADGAAWPNLNPLSDHGEDWVAQRAAEHWAWQPVIKREPPDTHVLGKLAYGDWSNGPIDAFIFERLAQVGLEPSPSASSSELLRRLSFDLTGLPPTLEQILEHEQLVATDPHLAYEQWVDRLLSSPQFGVQWGRHWLDLMRYAETLGHEFDFPIHYAWHYRDAVIDSLNGDVPYDQFVADHLAGDLVSLPRTHSLTGINQSLALTGWWWLGDSVHAPVDIKSDWATRLENQVDVLSKTFLGMTVACARCHDHKFDAIGMDDYYGLSGVVRGTRRRYAPTDPHGRITQHLSELRQQCDIASPEAIEAWRSVSREDVEQWLNRLTEQWRSLPSDELEELLPTGSPLAALKLLVPANTQFDATESQFAERLAAMRAQMDTLHMEYDQWQSDSRLLADFSRGLPEGWSLESIVRATTVVAAVPSGVSAADDPALNNPAPRSRSASGTYLDWFDGELPLPARRDALSSSLLGRNQYLTLRSPSFQVTEPIVCIKMRGKSARSAVVVDNYFMSEFHGLLFEDLQKPIDQPNDWGWVTHAGDLTKYIDHPAFISVEKESGAWFEIAEVRTANRLPPAQPHPWSIDLLKIDAPNRDAFAAVVIQRLHTALLDNQADVSRAMLRFEPELLLHKERSERLKTLARSLQQLDSQTPRPTFLLAAAEGTPVDAAIDVRGNPHQNGNTVPRGCFQWLATWQPAEKLSSGRIELARALTDRRHPLVARVMVNRVWHHLMGIGLVASTDNFGVLGGRPTHSELLDWLADQFIEHDWSIKWLVREIVTSHTYRLSSTTTDQQRELDADGRLWSHRLVRRLSAENLRDAILLTSDSLDERLSGPSVKIHLTAQMTGRGRPTESGPLDGQNRRSVFIEVRRNFLNPFLLAFDFPMPSTTTGRRNNSNVPAQALSLLNDPLLIEMSSRWAKTTQHITDPEQRVCTMIQTAFTRPASAVEVTSCLELIQQSQADGWQDLAHVLLNAKEFWYLR